MIGRQAVLPAQEAEPTARDMGAESEIRAFAGGNRHAPIEKEPPVYLAQRGARIDHERAHVRVVADARHQRRVDDHSDVRVVDKAFETVTAAARDNPTAFPHGVLNSVDHFVGAVNETDIVGLTRESFVESPADESRVPRIVRSNPVGNNSRRADFRPSSTTPQPFMGTE